MTVVLPALRSWSEHCHTTAQHLNDLWDLQEASTRWQLTVYTTGTPSQDWTPAPNPEITVLLRPGAALVVACAPQHTGCPMCLITRHQLATPNLPEILEAEHQWTSQDPTVTGLADPAMLARTIMAVARRLTEQPQRSPRRTMVRVDAHSLSLASHQYLPDPLCQSCGRLPADSAEAATLTLEHRAKPRPDVYRYEHPAQRLEELKDLYVDEFCGLLHSLQRDTQGGLAVAGALMKLRRHEWIEPGFGRSRNYETSEATAILEALERYGGVQPGGKQTVVKASLAQLGEDAVDPRRFGFHPQSTYLDESNSYRDFEPTDEHRWVWAYSFTQQRPLLVLESQAYYYVAHDIDTAPFVFEVSNGCALGSALEEAIFHGLLEVAERDAFLMTWYRRLALPQLRPETAQHPEVQAQLTLIERETGYEIRLYDQTMENGIPSVWATALHPGPNATDAPAQVCAAGAHPSLEQAALNALSEIGPFLNDFITRYPTLAARSEQMVDDPDLVRTMEDHSTLYGSPRMRRHLQFLDQGPSISFAEAQGNSQQFTHESMADDVFEMVQRFRREGQDVLVVDQTTDEHRAGGLFCVKILVTGSLTMTFGHHLRRTEGISRLATVPERLGLRSMIPEADTTLPHPFP